MAAPAGHLRPEELRRRLAKGDLPPVLLLSGPEARGKQEALAAIAGSVPEGLRAFNLNVFHAFEADLAEVLGAAATAPMMAPRRVVVLRDVEKMRLHEGGRMEMLVAYLKDPAPGTLFVVTVDDRDKAQSLARSLGEGGREVAFAAPKGPELAKRVAAEAARLGLKTAPGAVEAIVAAAGEDLVRVASELGKLRSALGEGGTVTEAEVARHVAGYAHGSAFDVLAAVSGRDLATALRVIGRLTLKPEDVLGMMGMVGKRLRVLWYLAEGGREVPKVYNVNDWLAGQLRQDAKRFTRTELERGLARLIEVDMAIKTTGPDPRLLLENFLIGFLQRA